MNFQSVAVKAAVLSMALAGVIASAQTPRLRGKMPVDFRAANKTVEAGTYEIVVPKAGMIFLRRANGENISVVGLPIQTSYESKANIVGFTLQNGEYHLTKYCLAGQGCWASPQAPKKAPGLEVALNR